MCCDLCVILCVLSSVSGGVVIVLYDVCCLFVRVVCVCFCVADVCDVLLFVFMC